MAEIPLNNRNASSMQQYNDEAFNKFNKEALVPCDICGRTFLPESLAKHVKGCKPKSEVSTSIESKKFEQAATDY